MRDVERRRFEMFVRVRDFGATLAASFAAGSRGSELFATLDGVVEELETQAAAQSSGASAGAQGTVSRAEAREELREDLEAISHTARAIPFDTPGLQERFRLPRGNRNDQQLLTTARAFASDAAPHKAEFIRHEMPANFLEDLDADIEAFESAITDQNRNRVARVSATEAIDAAITRGVEAVRQLDAIVRNKFRNDAATLAAWTSASHTERAPRTATAAAPQPNAGAQPESDAA
jgi:hypothetical protein